MEESIIGYTLKTRENSKITTIPMGEEMKNYFDSFKSYLDYIKEFLIKDKYYQIATKTLNQAMYDALPEKVKTNCKHCNGQEIDINDQLCDKYYMQMGFSFMMVSNEFISIVLKNRHIYNNKKVLFDLTEQFLNCISIEKESAILFFDLNKLSRFILNAGFLSISQIFSNSKPLNNLKAINSNLNDLDQIELKNKVLEKKDENFIGLQLDFFRNKQRYYKEIISIEKDELLLNKSYRHSNSNRPNRTDIAYFCFYTSETKELQTQNIFPSKKAWKEIAERFGKDDTNIQKAYNKIYGNEKERLKISKKYNIQYVLDNMLIDYPNAKKDALKELNIANLN